MYLLSIHSYSNRGAQCERQKAFLVPSPKSVYFWLWLDKRDSQSERQRCETPLTLTLVLQKEQQNHPL